VPASCSIIDAFVLSVFIRRIDVRTPVNQTVKGISVMRKVSGDLLAGTCMKVRPATIYTGWSILCPSDFTS
jgi:hypothetical protein